MKTIRLSTLATLLLFSIPCFVSAQVKISNKSWKQKNLSLQEKNNLNLALRFMTDGIAKGNLAVFDQCIDQQVTVHTGLKASGPIRGVNEYKSIFRPFAVSWPVTDFTIDEAFATNDKVVVRFEAIAYFKSDYYGVKATNQIINMKETHVLTVKNGKIISNVVCANNYPFEFIMYPALKQSVIGNLPLHKDN